MIEKVKDRVGVERKPENGNMEREGPGGAKEIENLGMSEENLLEMTEL